MDGDEERWRRLRRNIPRGVVGGEEHYDPADGMLLGV